MRKSEKLKRLEKLITELESLQYNDLKKADELGTTTRIYIRRFFGESSVYWHDIQIIRLQPTGFISTPDNYLMTGAWKKGHSQWIDLVKAMLIEISAFDGIEAEKAEINSSWIIKNLPWPLWASFIGIVVSSFCIGAKVGQLDFVKRIIEILG